MVFRARGRERGHMFFAMILWSKLVYKGFTCHVRATCQRRYHIGCEDHKTRRADPLASLRFVQCSHDVRCHSYKISIAGCPFLWISWHRPMDSHEFLHIHACQLHVPHDTMTAIKKKCRSLPWWGSMFFSRGTASHHPASAWHWQRLWTNLLGPMQWRGFNEHCCFGMF